MKAVALLVMIVAPSGFSQSTFIFANYHGRAMIDAPVFDASGNRLSGMDYVAVLYGGPTRDSLTIAMGGTAPMPPTSFTSLFNGQPGYFNLGPYVSIDTVPDSASAWLQVRAWDARLGQTYDEVAALGLGGYGESTLFYADGGSPIGVDFAKPLVGLQSFSLVPEPALGHCWHLPVQFFSGSFERDSVGRSR